jgi:2-desacetyl-2-hydroxyethyl bacteriochlorophyllide A dehydrogenase
VYPITPGHEFIGTIESAPRTSGFGNGDWVTIYPTQGCGSCAACGAGRPNMCRNFSVQGVHRDGGSFAELMVVPSSQLIAVPPTLRNECGALIEPVAVAVHANRRAGMAVGDTRRMAVIGAGVVGSLIAQVARASGADEIILADRLASRRQLCSDLGFAQFVHAVDGRLAEGLVATGGPLDLVFDNVCNRETIGAAMEALNPGGTLVLLGFPHGNDDIPLSYSLAYRREVSLLLSRNYDREDFTDALALLLEGKINAQRMVTGTWPLADFSVAYDALRQASGRHVKVMISS